MEAKGWGLDLIARIESKEGDIRKGDGKRVMKKVWERSGKDLGKGSNGQKKSGPLNASRYRMRQRPTLPPLKAVPSARPGLTSLFGMGRGGPRCYNHLNVFSP